MTLRQALTQASNKIAAIPHLRADAARDAELLLLNVLHIDRATLLTHPDRMLTAEQLAAYQGAIERRFGSEPIQYITGQQEFFGLLLKVTPATLIPRPETEHLVEAVLERVPHDRPVNILDVGTGSGAIALALAANLPQARLTAVDLSPAALAVARENASAHELDRRIRFFWSDLLDTLPPEKQNAAFDAVVSNPPYIPESDRGELHPQVREHEPSEALFAGPTGLDIYRRLIPEAHFALKPGGLLALEIGHGQSEAISGLLAGWQDITLVADLQEIPRVILARKQSEL